LNYIDQTGHNITLERLPKRIVSLVPSQTELLYHLGIDPIGQTIFCFHPKTKFKRATKIGGTKKLQLEKIRDLKPDLIIGNKEENQKEQIEKLREEFPVWLSDIYTLQNAIEMITQIGSIVGKSTKADALARVISNGFKNLNLQNKGSAVYLIWKNPYMAAGRKTFINSVLESAGYSNVIQNEASRYPTIDIEEMVKMKPNHILLSSEPFPFNKAHINEVQQIFPEANVKLVDGELYSWYGPRLLKTLKLLTTPVAP